MSCAVRGICVLQQFFVAVRDYYITVQCHVYMLILSKFRLQRMPESFRYNLHVHDKPFPGPDRIRSQKSSKMPAFRRKSDLPGVILVMTD